jgi:hypothetical protein
MEKLKQNSLGEYTIDNNPVTPVLVRGPYLNNYDIVNGQIFSEEEILGRIIIEVRKSGIDLEKIANSYTFAGCTVRVARTDSNGKTIQAEEKRMDVVSFYRSFPKGLN